MFFPLSYFEFHLIFFAYDLMNDTSWSVEKCLLIPVPIPIPIQEFNSICIAHTFTFRRSVFFFSFFDDIKISLASCRHFLRRFAFVVWAEMIFIFWPFAQSCLSYIGSEIENFITQFSIFRFHCSHDLNALLTHSKLNLCLSRKWNSLFVDSLQCCKWISISHRDQEVNYKLLHLCTSILVWRSVHGFVMFKLVTLKKNWSIFNVLLCNRVFSIRNSVHNENQ